MNTAQIIRELREKKGLSQDALAKQLGVDRTTIVKYESGGSKPTRKLKELAEIFNVSTDYLLGKNSEKLSYYIDEETARIANEMKENPGRRVLFDASRKLSPESIKEVQNYIEFLYQKQDDSNDD